jgi:hypothetical protein
MDKSCMVFNSYEFFVPILLNGTCPARFDDSIFPIILYRIADFDPFSVF